MSRIEQNISLEISELFEKFGRSVISDYLKVGNTSISNAIVRAGIPASWYKPLCDLGKSKDIDVPLHLFAWKKASEVVE